MSVNASTAFAFEIAVGLAVVVRRTLVVVATPTPTREDERSAYDQGNDRNAGVRLVQVHDVFPFFIQFSRLDDVVIQPP